MNTVKLTTFKAQPTVDPVPNATISITEELPAYETFGSLEKWDRFLDTPAEEIEGVLLQSLPGGVYDRLLGLMLTRKSSHFRVSHAS